MTNTPVKLTVTMDSDYGAGHYKVKEVLNIPSYDRYARFALGGWTKDGEGRMVMNGPKVVGPVAYAFRLPAVMCANPAHGSGAERENNRKAGIEFDVTMDTLIEIKGVTFKIMPAGNDNIDLVKV